MPRLYSGFPGRAPGAGLVLLRLAVGGTIAARIFSCAPGWQDARLAGVAVCLLAIGACIVFGFLTRIAAVILAILAASVTFSPLARPVFGSVQARPFGFDVLIIALAIALLGPGAFSFDAVLFGRRKVIIPRS